MICGSCFRTIRRGGGREGGREGGGRKEGKKQLVLNSTIGGMLRRWRG